MAMYGLRNSLEALQKIGTGFNEIHIDAAIVERARLPIDRMLDFAAQQTAAQ
jgi:quinolinate synthase